MNTTPLSCGAPVPGTNQLCTRNEGHDGEHRWAAMDVVARQAVCGAPELPGACNDAVTVTAAVPLVLPDTSNITNDPVTGHEIFPCPFCGGVASVEAVGGAVGVAFTVGCDTDAEGDCYGYQSLTTFARRSDAIAAWNRRTPVRP